MSNAIRIVILYAGLIFVALMIVSVWPVGADRLLVVMPGQAAAKSMSPSTVSLNQASHHKIYTALSGSDARVIDQVSSSSFIVAVPRGSMTAKGASTDFIRTLYGNGALLVINAAGDFGCGSPQKAPSFRSETI